MIRLKLTLLFFLTAMIQVYGQENKKWTLQECIDYGVEQSLEMRRQMLVNKTDNTNLRSAVLDVLPGVSGSTSIGYNFGRNIDPNTNTYTDTRSMANNYSVGASLNIFSGFSAINTIRYNNVSRMKGLKDTEKLANDIAIRIMQAFYDLAYAEGLIGISEEQFENTRLQLKRMERQHELGIKPKSDLFDIQAQLAEAEYNLISNQNSKATALISLKQLMNYAPESELEIEASSQDAIPVLTDPNVNEVFEKVKEELPEVIAAEYQVRAAKLDLYVKIGDLFPSINLSGNINTGYYDIGAGGFQSQFKNNTGKAFGLSMEIPIFSGLRRQANIRKANYTFQTQEIALQEKLQTVYKEVQQSIQDFKAASQEFAMAQKKVSFNSLSYMANQKKYEQGLVTIIDLNTSANNLLTAKNDLLKARLTFGIKKRMVDFYMGVPLQTEVKN